MKLKLIAAMVAASAVSVAPAANAQLKVDVKDGLKVSAGGYTFEVGGRIQYDYNRAEENGVVDEDQFDLRRGRIFVKGNISENWKYKAQFNVDGGGEEDLYLRYTGFGKGANVTFGNQKQPFGLEELTSSKDISVLERAALTELFAIGRAEGVQLHGGLAGNVNYGIGLFTDDQGGGSDEEFGFAARLAWAPVKTDTSVFHLGLAIQDRGDVAAGDLEDAFGVEAAFSTGPFHIQGEYNDGDLGGAGDTSVDGFYVQAGYILTGETRPYKDGKFKRVKPGNKGGAWEIVARYEDGDGNFGDIELGQTEADSFTLGLNWYAHKNVRFGVNYTDGEDVFGNDGEEFRVRFQLTY